MVELLFPVIMAVGNSFIFLEHIWTVTVYERPSMLYRVCLSGMTDKNGCYATLVYFEMQKYVIYSFSLSYLGLHALAH